uniref:DUF6273 domain-containing protein n=1 Tax=uncultured bacterium contig00107 TaxID=1181573 RepID=A0A806KLL7_9BACT|nr:hypothetical protein [uncultured bacterium contig00107]
MNKGEVTVKLGDSVRFGNYSWRVLDVQDGKALIISKNVLEKKAYHIEHCDVTWETCTLRQYLNGSFCDRFDTEDKARIAEVKLANNPIPWFGTSGGNDTLDKVFLLSGEEVVRYFGDSGRLENPDKDWRFVDGRVVHKDECDSENIVIGFIDDQYNIERMAVGFGGEHSYWWLRSSVERGCTVIVGEDGRIDPLCVEHFVDDEDGGVRPALWLIL